MRTRLISVTLTAALVLTGGALAGAEEVAEEPDSFLELFKLFTDREGDATGFVVDDVTPTSEDTLDLTEGRIGFDHATETLVFEVGVLDMTELPPSGAVGKTFYVNFSYDGGRYYVTTVDHAVEGQRFGLGTFNEQGFRSGLPAATVTGEYDYEADVVTIELSADEFLNAVPEAARFAEGRTVSSTDVLAQRYIGSSNAIAATPTSDTAVARSFTIPAPPEADEEEEEEEDEGVQD